MPAVDSPPRHRGQLGRRGRWWSAAILLGWVLLATIGLTSARQTADFPVQIAALVSNLEAVRADELIALHIGDSQHQTVLYCAPRKAEGAPAETGVASLDEACDSATGQSASVVAVSTGSLSATPRTLILRGIDLARSVREGEPAVPLVPAQPPIEPQEEDLHRAEVWGLVFTVIALILGYRSIAAAAMAFALGGLAVAVTWGALSLLSHVMSVPLVVASISALLALALGTDLAMQTYLGKGGLRRGGTASASACLGVTAVFLPLSLFPPDGMKALAVGAALASAIVFAGSVTLLPALSAFIAQRVERLPGEERQKPGVVDTLVRGSLSRPELTAGLTLAVMLPMSLLGFYELRSPHSVIATASDAAVPTIRTELAAEIERVTKGTIEFVVRAPAGAAADAYVDRLVMVIAGRAEFAAPIFVQHSSDGGLTVVTGFIVEKGAAQAFGIAEEVRAQAAPLAGSTSIGGPIMLGAQVDQILGELSIWGALAAAALATLVLAAGFRAPVMVVTMMAGAIIAALAALGILGWVTERGVRAGPFRIDAQQGLDPWAPLIVTCIVIATSTSYISLVLAQQRSQVGSSLSRQFAASLQAAPQLTTTAAVSIIGIGTGFTASGVSSLQQAGAGLAIALAIQATIVRCLLTPALLTLVDRSREARSKKMLA